MLSPQEILLLIAIAIWIDGLWLIKAIVWKRKPIGARTAQTLKGKGQEPRVESLQDLNYKDPWNRS